MKSFKNAKFKWTFRDYQQSVVDNAQKHLADGRIHIVAAPGSGKTILGLELIRMLNSPALVLSPSVTIRQQWGERWEDSFLPETEKADDYLSYDIREPALITSITYQALHAAFTKTVSREEPEDEGEEVEAPRDYSDFDLFATVKKAGIKTVCLDEAHHLRREWQKALEGFLEKLGSGIKVIALTATPPYDSTPAEWASYNAVCGEIDEEIFVPQLVAQDNLCPHQDYIYFNYPTEEEEKILLDYREKAGRVTEDILKSGVFASCIANVSFADKKEELTFISQNKEPIKALKACAKQAGAELPKALGSLTFKLPDYSPETAQTAFQFIIDSPAVFGEAASEQLRGILAENGLIEKRAVCLSSNEKIDKMLISSAGKLKSIEAITAAEAENMGEKLRMLILTDFIKKDLIKAVGTDEKLTSLGTVPVFETVRRAAGDKLKVAVLSGTLVIVPDVSVDPILEIASESEVKAVVKHIENTAHSELVLSGSNKNKVAVITDAFGKGLINVLVGTKSLLGEGWDAPCINSLILASFVGSFMLSNQMRGRAIRTDKADKNKASNIWHLVTAEPREGENGEKIYSDGNTLAGQDFRTLQRRFSGFIAPAYNSEIIESGMDRIDILTPPYDEKSLNAINDNMLALAADRTAMAKRWKDTMGDCRRPEVLEVNEVPATVFDPKAATGKKLGAAGFGALGAAAAVIGAATPVPLILGLGAAAVCAVVAVINLLRAKKASTPVSYIGECCLAVLNALKKTGDITSENVSLDITPVKNGEFLNAALGGATVHEKRLFANAVSELFSAIDDPRYLLVGQKKLFNLTFSKRASSFACPSLIAKKKEYVNYLLSGLKPVLGTLSPVYTRSDNGREELVRCQQESRLNALEAKVTNKQVAKMN